MGPAAVSSRLMPRSPARVVPSYLRPYERARLRRARGVAALLYDDREAQVVRFEALARNCELAGRSLLDVGCGHADLLGFLAEHHIEPASYIGLEAMPSLVRSARRRGYARCEIREVDFVREPRAMHTGAEVILFSGSLNVLPSALFYRTLERAWQATTADLAFNFLTADTWAGERWLHWHHQDRVLTRLRALGATVLIDDRYVEGDCTVVASRRKQAGRAPRKITQPCLP